MKAVVVYESLWGNTADIARAVAEGIGNGTRALSTGEATREALEGVDLIVGGAPLLGFTLPTDQMRANIATNPSNRPPDLKNPSMRAWLAALPAGAGRSASFETRIWWSPGSAAKTIATELADKGFAPIGKPERFVVTGRYGPLRDGEVDRARRWGAGLARSAAGGPAGAAT